MKRRNFIQMLAATGMTASLPLTASKAHAAAPDHFLVMVNAGGGWDPTSLCDPKGNLSQYLSERPDARNEGSINSVAINTETKRNPVSGMTWSDTPRINNNDDTTARVDTQFQNFFTTYHDKLTVINGIDNGTNNHSSGNRATWSGNLEVGYPSLAALFAASKNPSLPMAYISNGGYDFTASLVSRARASSAGFIDRLADPNSDKYHYRNDDQSTDIYAQIRQAQAERLARQKINEALPLRRQQLNQLFTVRQEDNNLAQLSAEKTIIEAIVPTNDHMYNRDQNFKKQASLIAAAFKAGIAASANLSTGGFDTHGNHDNSQYQNLGDLLEGVAYLQEALTAAGIADKTTVVIGSDFGRTPYYNSGNGKDHWPVTSVMVMHPTNSGKGGNVFGASTDKFRAQMLNRTTGQPDEFGQLLTPAHINLALRKELGIHNDALTAGFPLNVDDFSIFS
ncbi:conserved hypothetical protein [Oleispira antarctica RB-8]|mgnify:CR=1 FL=1|uniref:Tat pathway signal protein n=1 Tax=Oleispira antarctica RB-8 TaxID=698738 RepID=R4YTJ1_OLEAN|nr:conserved hypothetical protein [Oleispira antarctica RB-8]